MSIVQIAQYDSSGKYRRTLGRSGKGPGEYQTAFPVKFGARDSLYVFDLRSERLTVLAADGRFARSVQMPMRVSAAVLLSDGNTAVFSMMGNAKQPGLPLHIVDAAGKTSVSFGADNAMARPKEDVTDRRVIARSSRGIWAARLNEYRLEEWDTRGQLLRTLLGTTAWFPKWEPERDRVKPTPGLYAVPENRAGLLWTLTRVRVPRGCG